MEVGHDGGQCGAELQLREVAYERDERQDRDGHQCGAGQFAVHV